jgi:hypothetical protein
MVIGCSAVLVLVMAVVIALLPQQQSAQLTKSYQNPPFSKVSSNITSTSCIDNQPCVTTVCVDNNPCLTYKSNSNNTINDDNENNININPPSAPSPDSSELVPQQNV